MNNNFENITEAYLQGRLEASEAVRFEQSLEADPNLKGEFDFQRNIIEGVKEYRKAELKSYLNSVPVSSTGLKPIQYLAMMAAASIVAGLLFIFLQVNNRFSKQLEKISVVKKSTTTPEIGNNSINESSTEPIVKDYEVNPSAEAPKKESFKIEPKNNSKSPVTSIKKTKNYTPKESKVLVASASSASEFKAKDSKEPDMMATNDFESSNVNLPKDDFESATLDKKTNIGVVLASAINKGSLHYQYFNNKLYLYGNFNKSTYELIEMYTNKRKNLYMYFDSQFYEIEQNKLDITEMEPLKSAKLVDDLKKLIRVN